MFGKRCVLYRDEIRWEHWELRHFWTTWVGECQPHVFPASLIDRAVPWKSMILKYLKSHDQIEKTSRYSHQTLAVLMVWSALLFCWAGTAEPLGMPCPCDPSLWRDVGAPRSWWNLGCAAGANAAKFCDSWWVCQFHWVAYIYIHIYSKYMYLHSIVLKLYPSFPIKCSIIMGFFINWGNGRLEPARARETGLVGQVYQSYCYIYIYII